MSDHMSTSKNYPGQDKRGIKSSYCGFLKASQDIIIDTISSTDTCDSLNTIWFHHFLMEVKLQLEWKNFVEVKNKAIAENSHYTNYLQAFWKNSFKEYKKENLDPAAISHSENAINVHLLDNLVYRQVDDDAILIASAYKNLIADNIMPFIKILKTSLLNRSQMSLSSANEPVLQAIVEKLLPSNYCMIPELSLVINGKKPKGSGRFGYLDIFILSNTGNNNVGLELKYIPLIGLNINQKNNLGANELENLDKILEKENIESVLKRPYSYWSKEDKKTNLTL
ncbi:hypothetical protein C1646_758906 [Rhizophagus diaphanus]|nr:hypothetical protein C1646_758906 [Rhizophagus diaphanus] [Rhizophagus sp. MUCL 43196]